MNLTEAQLRNIIREELYVPNHLRAKPFSMHIFERDYVVNVLCLDVPLNESYPYSPSLERRIIQEQLMLEGFFSDILQKGKDALMSTVDGVKQFGKEAWSVLKGFYLAVKEGKTESLFRAIAQDVIKNIYIPLKKALAYLVEKLPDWKMPTFAKAAQKALDLLKGLKDKMMSAKGWQKIAMASGVAIGLTWLWEKIGDSIEELTGETDGLTLSEAEGDSKIAKIKAIIKDGWPGVFKAITGSNFKEIVEKVAMASSIGPWWEAAKSVGKGAAIVTAAIGGATAKFVDDHEEGERIKKGTTKKEEQNESWYRVAKQGNDGSILYPVRQKRLAENVLLREYIRTMILEKELRGQKSKRTLYHIGKRPASPKPAERWGAKGEEGWSRDWIEGPVKSGVFLTPNPTDIAWNHGVSGNVYAYKVPHWVIEKSGGVNRFDTGSEVLISQEVWEEAGDEIEFLGKTMNKDELWDSVDSSYYSAKQKKGIRGPHKHKKGASLEGLRATSHPEAVIKMMSPVEIEKALEQLATKYEVKPDEIITFPNARKGLRVPHFQKKPDEKDQQLLDLLNKHMNEVVVRRHMRELIVEETSAYNVVLDLAGLIPGLGEFADAANVIDYARKGDYLFAALSLISLVPVIGDAVGKGGKLAVWFTKAFPKGSKLAGKHGPKIIKKIDETKDLIKKNKGTIDKVFDEVEKNEKFEDLKPHLSKIKEALNAFVGDDTSDNDNVSEVIIRGIVREQLQAGISLSTHSPKDLQQRFDAFMKEYESLTKRNPIGYHGDRYWYMGEIEGKYCLVVTNLNVFDGAISFNSIQTVPPDICEKKGFASKVMNQIVALADKHQVPMSLEVSPFGQESLGEKELESWYRRAGFERPDKYSQLIRQPK